MKRLLFVCLVLLLGSQVYSQSVHYGFSGGFNFSRLVNNRGLDTSKYKSFTSPSAGAFVNINFSNKIALHMGFRYSLNGGIRHFSQDTLFVRERLSYHYVKFPIAFQYTFKNFIFFRAGIYNAFLTSAFINQRFGSNISHKGKIIDPTRQRIEYENIRDEFHVWDMGLSLSWGMQFADGISLELKYSQGFRPVKKDDQVFNSVFTLSLNYIINYSPKATRLFHKPSRHVFYAELGGVGFAGTLNYEYIFAQHKNIKFAGRIGLGVAPFETSLVSAVSMPVGIIAIVGKRNHHLEAGFAHTTTFDKSGIGTIAFFSGGYRFQKPTGGFFLRIAYTPMIANYDLQRFNHWAGLSVGYALRTRDVQVEKREKKDPIPIFPIFQKRKAKKEAKRAAKNQ